MNPILMNNYILRSKCLDVIFVLVFLNLLTQINPKKPQIIYFHKKYISFGNEIILKIQGKGEQTFIVGHMVNFIEAIYDIENDNQISKNNNKIILEKDENIIKITFNSLNMNSVDKMFQYCHNITEIDLSNFTPTSVSQMNEMFEDCFSLISLNFGSFDTSNVGMMQNMFKNCKSLKSLNLSNFDTSKANTLYEMFSGCINLVSLNLSNFNIPYVNNIEKMFYNCNKLVVLDISNFNKTDIQMWNLFENTPNNMTIVLNNKNVDIINKVKEKCPNQKFNNEFPINDMQKKLYISCEGVFDHFPIFENDLYFETQIITVTDNIIYKTFINDKTTNLLNINTIRTENIENSLDITTINISKSINLTKLILEGDITSLLNNIENEIFIKKIDNMMYYISTLTNQNKQNSSFIDLGDCESLLKTEYDIKDINKGIFIFKKENFFEGINIPIIEYELYKKDGTKLSLDICKNNITYFIPVSINESDIFKYDPNSNFYNNRCDKFTTENDTDMTLFDRKNEYNNKNLSLCEFNCTFKGYNPNSSKVECDCLINTGINRLDINQADLLNKLKSSKNIMNVDVIQCSEVLTSTEDIKSNPGFFLLVIILVIFIIIFIIFYCRGYNILKNKIEDIIYKRFNDKNNNNNINKSNNLINSNKNNLTKKRTNENKKKKSQKNQNNSLKELKPKKIKSENKKEIKRLYTDITKNKEDSKKIFHETDYELNNALYEDAKRFDKRSKGDYYCSLLKNKQMFIFTFLNFDDYNSGILKKFIFFLLFALHYTINALFFTDSNMHQIFQDQGDYNIKYQIKFIIVSAILSTALLRIILITLVLTDKNIFEIKCQPNIVHANALKTKTLRNMKIKFGIFFLLNLILLTLFWYYLTCWNAVYKNTQIYLIKNTLISFAISLLYPFVINIIPVILRTQSLKNSNGECLYNASKIIQLF